MDSKNTKLIVVKLDDESSPLMKDYVDPKEDNTGINANKSEAPERPIIPLPDIAKPKENNNNSINFDELSFSKKLDMEPKPAPPIPQASTLNSQIVPFNHPKPPAMQDFSLLAASREVKEEDKNKNSIPSIYNRPKPALPPLQHKPKPKKVRIVPPFKNEPEDGYKIGFLPTVKHDDALSKMPKKPSSLSKMETLLGIKAKVTGR